MHDLPMGHILEIYAYQVVKMLHKYKNSLEISDPCIQSFAG